MRRYPLIAVVVMSMATPACWSDIKSTFDTATAHSCLIAGTNLPGDIDGEVSQPMQCRYTIFAALEKVTLSSRFGSNNLYYVDKVFHHNVFAGSALGNAVMETVESTFQQGGGCLLHSRCMTFDGSFTGGTFNEAIHFNPPRYVDVYSASGPRESGGTMEFLIQLVGGLGALGNIIGPASFTQPNVPLWQADVTLDTGSYSYKWLVNGNLVQNGARTFYSGGFGESGTYSLTAIAKLHDNSTDTVTKSIAVSMGAAWTGPTSIGHGETGTWEAIGYGARYPLSSCEWSIDYSVVQTGSCTLNYSFPTPQTAHTIGVTITDARSLTASGSNMVSVYTSGCMPPECYETKIVGKPKPKPRPMRPRRP